MKTVALSIMLGLSMLALTACNNGGGGSNNDRFLTSPNSCLNSNYYYNQQYGYYMDQYGHRVNCTQGYFNGTNNYFTPYNVYNNGYTNGCSSWSIYYPGSTYVPVNTGYGYVCVKVDYFNNFSTNSFYNSWYSSYGYPNYAYSCQYGANCPSNCLGGSGYAGAGGLWLGGSLALCWGQPW